MQRWRCYGIRLSEYFDNVSKGNPSRKTLFAGVGPVSSLHDRACELFYALLGGADRSLSYFKKCAINIDYIPWCYITRHDSVGVCTGRTHRLSTCRPPVLSCCFIFSTASRCIHSRSVACQYHHNS
ncbi:hypothetical protein BDR03DRAFT_241839 [Suillus americanus]|nr:hypothetical protein BDR03DRAFT_241839 [Suillus americanus]